jgi:hypothetical protein
MNIKTRWTSLIDEAYQPYTKSDQERLEAGEVVLTGMKKLEAVGVRFLDTILQTHSNDPRYWYLPLFDNGSVFFKYMEIYLYNNDPTPLFKVISSEFEQSDIAADIEYHVNYAFMETNYELVCYLFECIQSLYNEMSKDGQESVIESIPADETGAIIPVESIKGELIEPSILFHTFFQTGFGNHLPRVRGRDIHIPKVGNDASFDSAQLTFKLRDYKKHKVLITKSFIQFFGCLMVKMQELQSPKVVMTLDEFMEWREIADVKDARKQVHNGFTVIKSIVYDSYEITGYRNGRPIMKKCGERALYGGTHELTSTGHIHINFNQDFFNAGRKFYSSFPLPKEVLKINTNHYPSTLSLCFFLSLHYRINERSNGETVFRFNVTTLLDNAVDVPSYETIKNTSRAYKEKIVVPFLRDLGAVPCINFRVIDRSGNAIDPMEIPIVEFLSSQVEIDFSQYPTNPERTLKRDAHRKRHKEQIAETTKDLHKIEKVQKRKTVKT